MSVAQEDEGAQGIEISEEMWNKLNALPFVSRKFSLSPPFQ